MKKKILIATMIISFLLAATTTLEAGRLALSDKSYGLVTFGNKLKVIEKEVEEKAKGETGDKGCDFVTFKKYPGIKFMVEDGIVTRQTPSHHKYKTSSKSESELPWRK